MENNKILKEDNFTYSNKKEVEMAKKKKERRMLLFLQIIRWLSLVLAILFFLWLAKNLGWLGI